MSSDVGDLKLPLKKTVLIGNDHGGYSLKLKIVDFLQNRGINVIDVGSDSEEIVRYPYYAVKVAGEVSKNNDKVGILICSTGIGMSMVANKFKGVRASLCTNVHMAHMTREHNDSNILCLGGKITADQDAIAMVDEWINTAYIGGRHDISLGLMSDVEEIAFTGADVNLEQYVGTVYPYDFDKVRDKYLSKSV